MKKIFSALLIIILYINGFGQSVVPRSNSSITVQDSRWQAQYNLFVPRYADTTAANLQKGLDSLSAIIYTYDVQSFWGRQYSGGKKWVALGSGGGGGGTNPFLPVSGTGVATGSIIGNLAGNTLNIQQGGEDFLNITPTANSESSTIRAFNSTAGDNVSFGSFSTTDAQALFNIQSVFDAASKSASISGFTDATTSTLTYTADTHTINGNVGIGVTPTNLFQVQGGGNTYIDVSSVFNNETINFLAHNATGGGNNSTALFEGRPLYSNTSITSTFNDGETGTLFTLYAESGQAYFNLRSNNGVHEVVIAGDANGDSIYYDSGIHSFEGDVIPLTNDTYTLGYDARRWADVFVGPASLHIGTSTSDEGLLSYNTTTNVLALTSTGAITINGNTITAGTGTLTIGAGKTLTASNTITFTATDGSTLAIGGGGTLGTNAYTSTAYAPLASPTFTGTVTLPTPFTIGAVSMTSTGTQLNYLNAATGTTGTTSTNVVFSTSPTLVTPTLGVATATSINKVTITAPATSSTLTVADGSSLITSGAFALTLTSTATSNATIPAGTNTLYSTLSASITSAQLATSLTNETGSAGFVVFSDGPTFTGTVTIPTPFTLGATSVTSTGTQLNYLNGATGTTGTTSTNVVFSASPTFTGTVTTSVIAASGFSTFTAGLSTSSTAGNSNLYVSGGVIANRVTTASLLPLAAAGIGLRTAVNGTTNYTMTASDAFGSLMVGNTGGVTEASSGTHPIVASAILLPITVTNGTGATDILAGLYIGGPATGVTPTTASYGLWLDAGNARLDGNVIIGGTAVGTNATTTLAMFNGTVPASSPADGCQLYTEDVASSSELKVRDEAGNVTTLSPHNFTGIPDGRSEDMAWSFYSEKDGKYVNVDMLKLARLMEKMTGEKLVYTGKTTDKPNKTNK